MIRKILIVDKAHPALSEKLEGAGFCCSTNLSLTKEQFLNLEDDYIGIVIRSRFVLDYIAFESKPNLKFVVRLGAGMESIDVEYAKTKGIVCLSTPEGNAPAVAQLCLGFLLDSLRLISEAHIEVQNGLWLREKNKGLEVGSLTIGIIGFGNTGSAFFNLLKPFNSRILCYDKFKTNYQQEGMEVVSLDYLLQESDVISIHINYIPENYYFVNQAFFNHTKKRPVFINSSRGLVVNSQDLLEALNTQKIKKAYLDVNEFENVSLQIPPKDQWSDQLVQLTQHKNVMMTPHIGGQTFESEQRHAEIAFQKIISLNIFE